MTEERRFEDRALAEKEIRGRAEAWCNENVGGKKVGRYLQEYLNVRAANVSSGHPLGLGVHRVLAGYALLRLIAGTHKTADLETVDFDAAVSRISDRMPRERNPLRRQAMEHHAEQAWPSAWKAFRDDLEFLPEWAQEVVRDEATELVATLRKARGKRPTSSRPKPDADPHATSGTDLIDEMIRQVMETPVRAAPKDEEKAPESKPGRKKGHLRRVI